MKGPIEIIYISDDEPNDCLINSAGSCLKSDSQAMSSDGKRLLHNLQGETDHQRNVISV